MPPPSTRKATVLRNPSAAASSDSGTNDAILLPKYVYIRDRNGHYLSVRSGSQYLNATLTFRAGDPDLNCAFGAVPHPSESSCYKFCGSNGYYIRRCGDKPGWYSCDNSEDRWFQVITSTQAGNLVYLQDYTATRFISDELTPGEAPVAHDYINASSQFEIIQAACKNVITDIKYDIDDAKVVYSPPLIAFRTTVRNDSDSGSVNQTLKYSYEQSKTGTWNNTAGIAVGEKATFEEGVPFVFDAKFEVSVSASYSHQWGGSVGTKQTMEESTTVTVPSKTKARATVIVKNARLDVGFTYTQKILWANGESEELPNLTGIYKNVDSYFVDVELDNWEEIVFPGWRKPSKLFDALRAQDKDTHIGRR